MVSSEEYRLAAHALDGAKRVLITTHMRPDGDACGCVRALMEHLMSCGKTVSGLVLSPLASWYAEMFECPVPVLGNDVKPEEEKRECLSGEFSRLCTVLSKN